MTSRIDFKVLLLFGFLKKYHLPVGKSKTEFTSPIVKSTSPGLSDTTLFARFIFRMMVFDYNNKDAFRLSKFVNPAEILKKCNSLNLHQKTIIITMPLSILKIFYINAF